MEGNVGWITAIVTVLSMLWSISNRGCRQNSHTHPVIRDTAVERIAHLTYSYEDPPNYKWTNAKVSSSVQNSMGERTSLILNSNQQ